jgi:2'-hydroxyisoflavone reductase
MLMRKSDIGNRTDQMANRRAVLKRAATVAAALYAGRNVLFGSESALIEAGRLAREKLDLLVLGGTGFIGPHLVRHAVSRGHRVTIFTRGRRKVDLPDEVVRLTGDRNGNLKSLEGKKWDAVVDDSATNPD